MQSSIWKFLSIVLLFAFGTSINAAENEKRGFTLVIDAGHGGHDPGASGKFSKEKNINLKVALAFGKLVEANCPDVRVIYTRRKDIFIPLQRRADIANKNKADLFISIHTNALPRGKLAYGSETYTLGMARADANLEVAKRENSVIKLESNYEHTYEGFDPRKAESYVIFEFLQDRYMKQSVDLAKAIQQQYKVAGRANKGVHQAGFLVLRNTSMPAVLTELGFITTPAEEKYLNSEKGVRELSRSIYNGFLNYRRIYNKNSGKLPKNLPVALTETEAKAIEKPAENKLLVVVPIEAKPTPRYNAPNPYNQQALTALATPTDTATLQACTKADTAVLNQPLPLIKAENRLVAEANTTMVNENSRVKTATPTSVTTQPAVKKVLPTIKQDKKLAHKQQTVSTTSKQTKAQTSTHTDQLYYHIQLGAGKRKISTNDPQFKGFAPQRIREGALYKYHYGNFSTYAEARKQLAKVRQSLPTAYIVAYLAGNLIPLHQAQTTEKKSK
mgnify:CR=1 FL=1